MNATEALKLAREALTGWMDQPDTPAAYDASMARAVEAVAAIDSLAADADALRLAEEARYRFLLGFLIERGVLTDKRYNNGTWSLQGIYGVDDSGLRGAGRTPEEALDNAMIAVNLDPQAKEKFWRETHAALARPAPAAQPDEALKALNTAIGNYAARCVAQRMIVGRTKELTKALASLAPRAQADEDAARLAQAVEDEGAIIKAMADRFLRWPLPDDFTPDGGITFAPLTMHPTGTNLLRADQALAMVKFLCFGIGPLPRMAARAQQGDKHE